MPILLRVVPILWLAFKTWMMADAYQRKAPAYWYPIILLIPGGAIAYLFVVKRKDINTRRIRKLFEGPVSVDQLRHRHRTTPSLHNQVALAQGLYDDGAFDEAETLFSQILEEDGDNKHALHGLGLSRLAKKDLEGGIEVLYRLVERDPAYREWVGPPDLADALFEVGQKEEGLRVLRDLVTKSPRVKHKVCLTHYLIEAGRDREARPLLEEAMQDHRDSPAHVKRLNRRWVAQAKRMLKMVSR